MSTMITSKVRSRTKLKITKVDLRVRYTLRDNCESV